MICADAAVRPSARALWLPKAGNAPEEYEDAFAVDPALRRAAVADGASDSYDSGRWARLLVDAFVDVTPAAGADGLRAWLAEPARRWAAALDRGALPWNQQEKSRLGAHCTFLGLELDVVEPDRPLLGTPCGRWRAVAVGDACLFQVRDDALLAAFPLAHADKFGSAPALLATAPAYRGPGLECAAAAAGDLRLGDTFFLATDALAQWFLRHHAEGGRPWRALAAAADAFAPFAAALRAARRLRNDDTTLLRLDLHPADAPVPLPATAALVSRCCSRVWLGRQGT